MGSSNLDLQLKYSSLFRLAQDAASQISKAKQVNLIKVITISQSQTTPASGNSRKSYTKQNLGDAGKNFGLWLTKSSIFCLSDALHGKLGCSFLEFVSTSTSAELRLVRSVPVNTTSSAIGTSGGISRESGGLWCARVSVHVIRRSSVDTGRRRASLPEL